MDCTLYLHAMLAMVAVVDLIRSFWGRTKRGTKVSAEGTAMSLQNDTAARVPRRDSVWRTVSSAATPQLLRRVGRYEQALGEMSTLRGNQAAAGHVPGLSGASPQTGSAHAPEYPKVSE